MAAGFDFPEMADLQNFHAGFEATAGTGKPTAAVYTPLPYRRRGIRSGRKFKGILS
jgi:hypothetical protein